MSGNDEVKMEQEAKALAKLQAAAGITERRTEVERLDWMYEQSALQVKEDDDALMNMPVGNAKDKDMEDVKKLSESTAGSLFLKSATKTTEDMLRKLREDPLFQIRRQEQAARENMLSNPLVVARIKKKQEKKVKKEMKMMKKVAKKEKKALKKASKLEKKAAKCLKQGRTKSSTSNSASSSASTVGGEHQADQPPARRYSPAKPSPSRGASTRSRSPRRSATKRSGGINADLQHLGPGAQMVGKRVEYAAELAKRKEAALASRGAPRRMGEEEKQQRLARMQQAAAQHESMKDQRIKVAEEYERVQEAKEEEMRRRSDQRYFKEIRQQAYTEDGATMADRLRTQRHRRARNLNDPLERDG